MPNVVLCRPVPNRIVRWHGADRHNSLRRLQGLLKVPASDASSAFAWLSSLTPHLLPASPILNSVFAVSHFCPHFRALQADSGKRKELWTGKGRRLDPETFYTSESCATQVNCGSDKYLVGTCSGTGTSDQVTCANCAHTTCQAGSYLSSRCSGTGTSDSSECTACRTCPAGTYVSE